MHIPSRQRKRQNEREGIPDGTMLKSFRRDENKYVHPRNPPDAKENKPTTKHTIKLSKDKGTENVEAARKECFAVDIILGRIII